jgi:SAM-dependent MidA family methyltransferase
MTPESQPMSPGGEAPTDMQPSADPSAAGAVVRPPAPEGANRLADLIRSEIEASPDRRITFARYMELALYAPALGYYRTAADRPTDSGDFLTAPETHAIFGWTMARCIESIWAKLGRPTPFHLVEYGAGSGTLALSVLDGFRRHGEAELLKAIRYEPVESNPNRLSDLRERFEEAGLAGCLAAAGTPGVRSVPVEGVILANEFLDAMPVHRVVVQGGEMSELFVTWIPGSSAVDAPGRSEPGGAAPAPGDSAGITRVPTPGRFAQIAADPSTPELAARLREDAVELAERQVAEIALGLAPWLDEVSARLASGHVIAIDYGYDAAELYGPRHLAGTLLGYRGHRVETDPLRDPGLVDLTAHVDFTAVRRLAERRGFRTVSLTTQSEFLVAAGLEAELQDLQASPDLTVADYTRARSGIIRMLDPRHMGRFRVLTLARD